MLCCVDSARPFMPFSVYLNLRCFCSGSKLISELLQETVDLALAPSSALQLYLRSQFSFLRLQLSVLHRHFSSLHLLVPSPLLSIPCIEHMLA